MSLTRALHQISIRPALLRAFPQVSRANRIYTRSFASQGAQSISPLAPIGVEAALNAKSDSSFIPRPKIFDEFKLTDRVGIVSGGARGLGLEMAMTLCEAGARAVYCLDIHKEPTEEWNAVRDYVKRMEHSSRLEYINIDVTDQKAVWDSVEKVGDKEGRMDVCIAAAGILKPEQDALEYPADEFREVMNINVNGVLFTAQAAGRQMRRFGNKGSIILIASLSGSIANRGHAWISYNSSKSAVLQMARSMACELGEEGIRVNSLSPGHIYTQMTKQFLNTRPELLEKWNSLYPLGRIGRSDELRGVVAWLSSDASTFCTGSDIMVCDMTVPV
ncbi:hypothetical protein BDP27DRAFT_192629 [Rhodocollybia butyracea]|uniref:Sorbose reductase sou1 n=1 Tax=Rhodocollybia butyracea TaxID=206335 RepID=A0A9P5Q6F7_9AGAR|nr:hypothetical protein BDP27DRAFT_192629 [Rhodocollybia butyracea]